MIDSVIAGTGNSRFLRTSISASTTWEDALTMLRAGTFPIDLAGINIDGFVTVGTPLNAETLLKESVITALDLDENATPSDAWEKLIAIVNTKADADSVVTAITYDSAEKKLYATINGTPTLVTTFNFTTPQEAADAAPVQSVAGKTGTVALNADDVAYSKGTSYSANTIGKALEDDDARMGEIEGDISDIGEDITGINNELDALESDVEENYARVDGYYEEMTVGNAEQLVATVGIDDNAPYLFRTTGGSADVGDRKTMELVGGTVAWNQLVQNGNFADDSLWGVSSQLSKSVADNKLVATSVTKSIYQFIAQTLASPLVNGHKYIVCCYVTLSQAEKISFGDGTTAFGETDVPANTRTFVSKFWTVGADGRSKIGLYPARTAGLDVGETCTIEDFMLFDLTQMFGSAIADYIYSLEQAHAGDGVAWFRKIFPKGYYTYNAGELMSVKTSANITTGFNAYNHAEGVAKLVGGNAYQITGTYTALSYSTGETITPDESGYFTPYDSGVLTVTGGNATTTCVHLVWDGERDGEWEEYVEHDYPLDSDLELRGMFKLDANNELYYDGDIYESDGTVTRKYGIIDLGARNWAYEATGSYFRASLSVAKKTNNYTVPNIVCPLVPTTTAANIRGGGIDGISIDSSNYIRISWPGQPATASEAKQALSGVYLVYELTTPTTEEADPFTSPEAVDDFGTEQFVDTRDVPIPVGHNSVYQANLRAKLEMAPDSPDGDGDYLVRQTNGTNAYVPYILPTAGQVNFDDTEEYEDGSVGAELNRKADIDGTYEDMTVGNAQQLVATVGVEDAVPYIFRTTGGSADVGDRKDMTIVGGTIAWNQLINADTSGWLSTTATKNIQYNVPLRLGHKYWVHYEVALDDPDNVLFTYMSIGFWNNGLTKYLRKDTKTATVNGVYDGMFTVTSVPEGDTVEEYTKFVYQFISDPNNAQTTMKYRRLQLIDVTQLLGPAVADYIYSIDTTHQGDGAAYLRKMFPQPYYHYDAGTLMSVQTSANITRGFNQWDGEYTANTRLANYVTGATESAQNYNLTGYIPVLPNMVYYRSRTDSARALFYDADKNVIPQSSWTEYIVLTSGTTFTTPSSAYFVRFTVMTSFIDTFCINLSWDGERDGEYEPYESHTYALDGTLVLRGVPNLDSSNEIYYKGDTYESDGTVTRKFFQYTVTGDEQFSTAMPMYIKADSCDAFITFTQFTAWQAKNSVGSMLANQILVPENKSVWGEGQPNRCALNSNQLHMNFANSLIGVTDYTQETTATVRDKIKAYCKSLYDAGTPLIFILPLSTYTTETATEFISPQIVDDFGTEEFVDAAVTADPPTREVAVPVGHTTVYAANLRAKLEMAPDSPDGDGDYIVRQTNGENAYVLLEKELPVAPSENGTYVLKVTVSGGTASYSWEEQT